MSEETLTAIKCCIDDDCNNCPFNHLSCVGNPKLLLKWILEEAQNVTQ